MSAGLAGVGFGMLNQLFMNTSNRIGTGASLRRQQLREQARQTRIEAREGILGRVEGAKAAGLHPLVAMGSNVGGASVPVGSSFNGAGEFANAIAQANIANREMKMRKEELEYNRSMEKQNAEARKAQDALNAAETAARIRLITAQEESERKRMADSDRDFLAAQEAMKRQAATRANPVVVSIPSASRAAAARSQIPNQYVPVRDRFGNVQYIPNPDLYDLELPDAVGAGTLVKPEIAPARQSLGEWWEETKARERARRRGIKLNPNLPVPLDW